MALLDISKLTIRFGGLCAVNKVDLRVDEGAIVSVIGPNGAGKTTVFNGVTAIYEPTEGRIRCRGSDMRLAFRPRVAIACLLIGLGTALLAGMLSVNVDKLWKATVKQNYADPTQPFPVQAAGRDFRRYLRGDLRLEERAHRWHVVTYNFERSLASSPDRAVAVAKLAATREMIAFDGSDATLEERQGIWVVMSPDRTRTLAAFDTREDAQSRLQDLAQVGREARRVGPRFELGALLGFVVGTLGAFSVWQQTRRTPHIVARHGLARTFQNIRLFQDMSVLDNVLVGMDRHLAPRSGPVFRFGVPLIIIANLLALALSERRGSLPEALHALWIVLIVAATGAWVAWVGRRGALSAEELRIEAEARGRAGELLDFVGLRERETEVAKNLPYGDQRRLEIARALATRPALLLLDEPAAGMNPAESGDLMRLIRRIRDTGITVLLIEHHMRVVMGISDRIAVLDYGIKIAEGTPEEVRADPRVIEAYLGKEEIG